MRLLLLLLAVLGLAAPDAVLAEPRIALVIGNSAYDEPLGRLTNPENDARTIAASLRRTGFDVDLVIDADQAGMANAISRFAERVSKAGAGSTALFFYAGHGLQLYGVNYLVPVKAAIRKQDDIPVHGISANKVVQEIREAAAHRSILILDACRNNPLPSSMMAVPAGLAEMKAEAGTFAGGALIAYSTGPAEVAIDGEGTNSPYVTALSGELLKPGVPIEILFRNVRTLVRQMTGGAQEPWESTKMIGGDFTFVGSPPPPPRIVPAAPAIPAEFMRSIPIRDFAAIPVQTSLDDLAPAERYLREGRVPVQIRDVSPSTSEVAFFNTKQLYESRAFRPTVSPNVLTQTRTGNGPASFTLAFPQPMARVRLLVPRLFSATESGITFPAWKITALNAAGETLDSRGRALARSFGDIPEQYVTLEAPGFDGITAVRFESDPRLDGVPFAAFSAILVEAVWVEPMAGNLR